VSVDVRDDAAVFVEKWRARWPEWELAQVFIPAAHRPLVEAWFSLLQELTDAAWGGGDPTPGLAKLAWWQEELGGWAKGARRHPLGARLQSRPAPWLELGRALPDLRALREGDGDGEAGAGLSPEVTAADQGVQAGAAFAAAVAGCEEALFGGRVVDGAGVAAVLASLLGERELLRAASIDPMPVGDRAGRPASRPRGVQAALVAARIARPGSPVPPLRALFAAWRGARQAG
jgi:hypothetical protein